MELSLWEVPSKQGDWASLCLPPPDASPEIRIEPVKATIREGEGVVYLLRANGILTEDPQVPVSVSTDGDFGAGSGVRRVGIRRGTNPTYHQFQTTDDDTEEANSSVTAALRSGFGYEIAAAPGNQAMVRIVDNDPGLLNHVPDYPHPGGRGRHHRGPGRGVRGDDGPGAPLSDLPVHLYDNDGPPSSPPGLRLGRLEGESRLPVRWDEVPEATGYEVRWWPLRRSRRGKPRG